MAILRPGRGTKEPNMKKSFLLIARQKRYLFISQTYKIMRQAEDDYKLLSFTVRKFLQWIDRFYYNYYLVGMWGV